MTTGQFSEAGVQFQYPENWTVNRSHEFEDLSVSVESPDGAFWTLQRFPEASDPDEVMQQALQTMQAEYDQVEVTPVEETRSGATLHGYNLAFYCLDLLVQCHLRAWTADDSASVYLLMYQAEDREFDELTLVFQAMTLTLLAGSQTT